MKEYTGIVESVCGAKTLCVSVKIDENCYPRYIVVNNIVPRDGIACQQWLEENVVGNMVYFYPVKTNRIGQYVADIECNGFNLGQEMIKEGLAD